MIDLYGDFSLRGLTFIGA